MTKIVDYSNESLLFDAATAPATPSASTVRIYAKADGLMYSMDDTGTETSLGGGGGTGDVVGPASATDGAVALYDGVTGKLLKDGVVLGTAATTASTDYATASQGSTADSAIQPGDNISTLTNDSAFVDAAGASAAAPIQSLVEGTNITIDVTDPENPVISATGSASGDVVGPSSATDGAVALFDGTTGKLLKNGVVLGTAATTASSDYATSAQGALADSATQPGDLSTVATTGAYSDLTGTPTLGTSAALDVPASGNATSGQVVKGDDTRLAGGSGSITAINDQTGTSYTLVLGDAGKDVRCNNGATVTITIPPNSAVAFPVGTFLLFSQAGTGTVTAAAGAGVTLNAYSGYSTAGQHDVRGLEQVAADVWRVV